MNGTIVHDRDGLSGTETARHEGTASCFTPRHRRHPTTGTETARHEGTASAKPHGYASGVSRSGTETARHEGTASGNTRPRGRCRSGRHGDCPL